MSPGKPLNGAAAITHLIGRLGRLAHELQHTAGLPPPQWEALRYLQRANRFSRTPAGVADYLGSTRGTASQTVIALESKGYVRRRRSRQDGRVSELDLTGAGQTVLRDDPMLLVEELVAELDSDATAALTIVLGHLVSALLQEQQLPAFGVCGGCRHFRDRPPSGACALRDVPLEAGDRDRICVDFNTPPAAVAPT